MWFILLLVLYPVDCALVPSLSTTLNALKLFYDKVHEQQEVGRVMLKRLQFGRHSPLTVTSISPLDYPSTDFNKLAAMERIWEAYYQCADMQRNIFGRWRILSPRTVMALEGTSATLGCLLCRSPRDMATLATWHYSKNMTERAVPLLEEKDNTMVDPLSQDLHLFNVGNEDAGIYQCQLGHSVSQPYFLHVFAQNEEPVRVVRPPRSPKGPHPSPLRHLSDNVVLETIWGSWTRCSRCGKVGKKYRVGACTVRVTSFPDKHIQNEDENAIPDSVKEILALSMFYQGVPCRSQLVPPKIRKMEGVLTRPTEIMIAYCKVACSDTVFEIRDYRGQVLQAFNNSAGEFSVLQQPPHLQVNVRREYMPAPVNSRLVFTCPGSKAMVPHEWFVNRRRLVATEVDNATNGRMTIDPIGRIVITKVVLEDSHRYACYQLGRLVGVVRVDVHRTPTMAVGEWINVLNGCAIVYIVVTFLGGVYMNERIIKVKDSPKVLVRELHNEATQSEREELIPENKGNIIGSQSPKHSKKLGTASEKG